VFLWLPPSRPVPVRLVLECQDEYLSQWAAISSIATKPCMTPKSPCKWVRRAEIDAGERPGLATTVQDGLKELEKENRELRKANNILKAVAAFFGA
jgi:transposase